MLLGSAAAVVGAALVAPGAALARDDNDDDNGRTPLPQPKPIPGGLFPGFHVWGPGQESIVLPFSGFKLQGLDVDPSVITDFNGFTALAYPAGSAHGSDGKKYNLEGDMRVFRGTYKPLNGGSARQGAFGFV
jgi:hypothetical protein